MVQGKSWLGFAKKRSTQHSCCLTDCAVPFDGAQGTFFAIFALFAVRSFCVARIARPAFCVARLFRRDRLLLRDDRVFEFFFFVIQ